MAAFTPPTLACGRLEFGYLRAAYAAWVGHAFSLPSERSSDAPACGRIFFPLLKTTASSLPVLPEVNRAAAGRRLHDPRTSWWRHPFPVPETARERGMNGTLAGRDAIVAFAGLRGRAGTGVAGAGRIGGFSR